MVDRVIRIVLDADDLKRGLTDVKGRLDNVEKSSKRTGESMRALRSFAAGLIGALGTRELIRTADAFTQMQNRIRLVTDGTEELNTVTDRLVGLAQRTRSDLGATADLYSRVARSTEQLGASQSDLLTFTEAVNQSIQISGATAQEAAASTVQFAQGLAAGALRGDELRSVLEQNTRLARGLANQFGVSIGEIRRLGEAGELETERVFQAVLKEAELLNAEFSEIVPTFSDAFTTIRTFATAVIGNFNEAAGITRGLVDIFALTDEQTVELGVAVRNLALDFREFIEVATVSVASLVEKVAPAFNVVQAEIVKIIAAITRDEALFAAALEGQDEFLASIEEIDTNLDAEFEAIRRNAEERRKDVEARNADLDAQRQKKGAGSGIDPDAIKEAERLAKEQQKLFDQLVKQRTALEIVAETGREYSEVLVDLQIQSLAAATGNTALGMETAQAAEDVRTLTGEIKALEDAEQERLDRLDEATQITLDARDAQQVFNDEVARLKGFLDEGLITPEVFEASVENLKNLDDATQDFFRRARENSQDILAGFLESGLQDLDEFANQFATMLLQLSSQALAAEIFDKIFGQQGGGGGGGTGGIIQGILGIFGRQFGGGVQGGQAVGTGEGGRFGAEVFVPNTGGQVVPTGGDRGAPAAPNVNVPVSIVNTFDDRDVVGAFQSGGGDQVVLNMVSQRRRAFRQALGV